MLDAACKDPGPEKKDPKQKHRPTLTKVRELLALATGLTEKVNPHTEVGVH